MTRDEIRTFVATAIEEIAPDAALDALDPSVSLRDELDLDSMDFLALVRAIHEQLGVDIPEGDYSSVDSLDGCVSYLEERLTGQGRSR